jgi:hypothetical protein
MRITTLHVSNHSGFETETSGLPRFWRLHDASRVRGSRARGKPLVRVGDVAILRLGGGASWTR